jgi:hypothetical protein
MRREQEGLHDDLNTFMKSMGDNYDEVSKQIEKAIEQETAFNMIRHVPARIALSRQLHNL